MIVFKSINQNIYCKYNTFAASNEVDRHNKQPNTTLISNIVNRNQNIMLVPRNSQKRVLQRMNRTMGSDSRMQAPPSRNNHVTIKKILMISSVKCEVKKIFSKLLDGDARPQHLQSLIAHSKAILDNDKQTKLNDLLHKLTLPHSDRATIVLELIKEFVLSPLEKSYISKIEKQLKFDEQLQCEIKNIQEELQVEQTNKLKIYDSQKSGVSFNPRPPPPSQQHQNRLMRANQKLNDLSANNDKLRERINQLRKQKNVMEQIYTKLKKELQNKKENVEQTIKAAGEAYCARNQAQEDLRNLKEQAESRKEQFKEECTKINKEIQQNTRFRQFIKSKQVEREQLEELQEQVNINEQSIQLKKEQNARIDAEYQKAVAKEALIRQAFNQVKKHLGCGDVFADGKELLNVFVGLYEKKAVMNQFVAEIVEDVNALEAQIEQKKQELQQMYLRGSSEEESQQMNEELKARYYHQENKRKILQIQKTHSAETLTAIKMHLLGLFQDIGIDSEMCDRLRMCELNEENVTQFLGQLQKKGLESVAEMGKDNVNEQFNNLVTIDNVNMMNSLGNKISQSPSELLIKLKDDKSKDEEQQKPLSALQLKKIALESIEQYQKKQGPRDKHINKKYTTNPINIKIKKR